MYDAVNLYYLNMSYYLSANDLDYNIMWFVCTGKYTMILFVVAL